MQHSIIAGVGAGGVQAGFADSPLCQQRLCFGSSQGYFRMGKDTALFPECESADTVFAEIPLGMLRNCRASFGAAADFLPERRKQRLRMFNSLRIHRQLFYERLNIPHEIFGLLYALFNLLQALLPCRCQQG